VIESIQSLLERENPPTTYLFTGPGGTGKTTIARILAAELGCYPSDFKEINASDDTGIDSIRKLREQLQYAPLSGEVKVILLDEAHMLSKNSQEALLKMLEEPPPYVRFMICTTNPESLKPTFKRRCHQYELSLLKPPEILHLIKAILRKEKKDIKKFPQSVAELIVDIADGSAGQALKLLDMVIDMTDAKKMLEILNNIGISSTNKEVIDLCRLLIDQKMNNKTRWMRMSELLKELKTDGENARRPILGYLEKVLLNSSLEDGERIAGIMANFSDNYFNSGKAGLVMSCYLSCME
jgi:DNA polymerase III gamma/tau subunit